MGKTFKKGDRVKATAEGLEKSTALKRGDVYIVREDFPTWENATYVRVEADSNGMRNGFWEGQLELLNPEDEKQQLEREVAEAKAKLDAYIEAHREPTAFEKFEAKLAALGTFAVIRFGSEPFVYSKQIDGSWKISNSASAGHYKAIDWKYRINRVNVKFEGFKW